MLDRCNLRTRGWLREKKRNFSHANDHAVLKISACAPTLCRIDWTQLPASHIAGFPSATPFLRRSLRHSLPCQVVAVRDQRRRALKAVQSMPPPQPPAGSLTLDPDFGATTGRISASPSQQVRGLSGKCAYSCLSFS